LFGTKQGEEKDGFFCNEEEKTSELLQETWNSCEFEER